MNYKILPFLIFFIILLSCETVNVKDGVLLSAKKSEGFMYLSIATDILDLSVSLFPQNQTAGNNIFSRACAVFDKLYLGENFILIRLSSGYYSFKYIYYDNRIKAFEMEDVVFCIDKDAINYIGKLYILKGKDEGEILYYYIDDYETAQAFLNLEYPDLKNT